MKKLFSLLAVLLCLSVLVLPVFADLIAPPYTVETESSTEAVTTEAATQAAEAVKTAANASAAASDAASDAGQPLVYLVIGVAILGAAFLLWRQLRKRAK